MKDISSMKMPVLSCVVQTITLTGVILTTSCMSLDDKLASPDPSVRKEAYDGVLKTACNSHDWNTVSQMVDRVSAPDDLCSILFAQTHMEVFDENAENYRRTIEQDRLPDNALLAIATKINDEVKCKSLFEKGCWPAVAGITDQSALGNIARGAGNMKGRLVAVGKIKDQETLHQIAKAERESKVSRKAASMLTDKGKIEDIAKSEPNASFAQLFLKHHNMVSALEKLNQELNLSAKLVDAAAIDDAVDLSFLAPWVNLAKRARSVTVREIAFGHLPDALNETWTEIARIEVMRFVLSRTPHVFPEFERFDDCEPVSEDVFKILLEIAWIDEGVPGNIVLWAAVKDDRYLLSLLIDHTNDKKLLHYLSEHNTLEWRSDVDTRGFWRNGSKQITLANSFGEHFTRSGWESPFVVKDCWGTVDGLSLASADSSSRNNGYVYPPTDEARMRLAKLDRDNGNAIKRHGHVAKLLGQLYIGWQSAANLKLLNGAFRTKSRQFVSNHEELVKSAAKGQFGSEVQRKLLSLPNLAKSDYESAFKGFLSRPGSGSIEVFNLDAETIRKCPYDDLVEWVTNNIEQIANNDRGHWAMVNAQKELARRKQTSKD